MQGIIELYDLFGCDNLSIDADITINAHFPFEDKPDVNLIEQGLKWQGFQVIDTQLNESESWDIVQRLNVKIFANRCLGYRVCQFAVIMGCPTAIWLSRRCFTKNGKVTADHASMFC